MVKIMTDAKELLTKKENSKLGIYTVVFGSLCLLMTGFIAYMTTTELTMKSVFVALGVVNVIILWMSFANMYMTMKTLSVVE